MSETWSIDDEPVPARTVRETLRERIERGQLEIQLTSSAGRSISVLTNRERALVMLLEQDGDPGEHAVDPAAGGSSSGFELANGQHDTYPDRDTVPIGAAVRIVAEIVGTGSWPPDTHWVSDR